MKRADIFNSVGGASPPRTAFDLSYEVKTTTDFSGLIPVQCDECVPGDVWKMGVTSLIRMNPLAVPIMHGIKVSYHTFFVPYRLLWEYWEQYVTGGPNGDDTHVIPKVTFGTDGSQPEPPSGMYIPPNLYNNIWDYLGFPPDINRIGYNNSYIKPISFPIAAYDFIYYEYYRDQNYCNVTTLGMVGSATPGNNSAYWDKIRVQIDNTNKQLTRWSSAKYYTIPQLYGVMDVDSSNPGYTPTQSPNVQRRYSVFYNSNIWMRNRKKDYFNSVLPSQQRGIAPAFPLTGNANFNTASMLPYFNLSPGGNRWSLMAHTPVSNPISPNSASPAGLSMDGIAPIANQAVIQLGLGTPGNFGNQNIPVNMGAVTAATVTELRDNIQLQKWLERAMRGGVRYTEWLKAMFGVNPRDDRLDRPEYIGGYKRDVLVTEVLQTSQTTQATAPAGASALGDYGGHGISAGSGYIGTYKVQEFGLIMTLMSIMPDEGYEDMLNRQWIKFDRFDFYNPLFAHLSEEAVLNAELRYNATAGSNGTDAAYFGFQGIWNWMRFKPDMVTGKMRLSATTWTGNPPTPQAGYGQWQMCRHWALGTVPVMNQTFLIDQQNWNPATGQGAKRGLAVPSEPAFIVNHRNNITCIRPLPFDAEPGMMDHF